MRTSMNEWVGAVARSLCDAEQRLDGHTAQYEVFAFNETWSDTSLGRGGMAGQAITTAVTVVVVRLSRALVYRAGRFDYEIEADRDFRQWLSAFNLPGRKDILNQRKKKEL